MKMLIRSVCIAFENLEWNSWVQRLSPPFEKQVKQIIIYKIINFSDG